MFRTILRHSIETLAYLSLFAIFGVSFPLALVVDGFVPLYIGLSTLVVSLIGWVIFWNRWERRLDLRNLPLGARETWFFTVTAFFGIIGGGISLVNLSTFGAQTISSSHCISPTNVNVTSPNC